MPTLNVHKAIQEIRLDDSSESPVFTLDLTDSSMNEKTPIIAGCYVVYQRIMKDYESGDVDFELTKTKLASIYEQIIELMLGQEAYLEIFEYIRNGKDIEAAEITMAMAPVVEYLLQEFDAVLTANRSKVVQDFLEESNGAGAL